MKHQALWTLYCLLTAILCLVVGVMNDSWLFLVYGLCILIYSACICIPKLNEKIVTWLERKCVDTLPKKDRND